MKFKALATLFASASVSADAGDPADEVWGLP